MISVKRGKIDFINDKFVMVLDRCKVSDRNAVHILMATAEALGYDTFTKDLSHFVTKNTKIFFERFNIDMHFLNDEPDEWINNTSYNDRANTVAHINVVNDTAERGVKQIEEYNSILTKDEEQKQYLLQIVKNYKIKYPDSNKSTLQ
ncbi:hypothetical protein QTP88_006791 [Uroleucon formosanum]